MGILFIVLSKHRHALDSDYTLKGRHDVNTGGGTYLEGQIY